MRKLKINKPLDVPGWTNSIQHREYKDLVAELPENPRVLEIGCGYGRSTWAWLDALPPTSTYCVLDNFRLTSKWLHKSQYTNYKRINPIIASFIWKCNKRNTTQREIFDKFISYHPNQQIIKTVWEMDSDDWIVSKEFTNNWDLVYLDDRHEYEVMKQWLSIFSNVSIVCGDDYNRIFQGIIDAVDEYSKDKNVYKHITRAANFFIIKNKSRLTNT